MVRERSILEGRHQTERRGWRSVSGDYRTIVIPNNRPHTSGKIQKDVQ